MVSIFPGTLWDDSQMSHLVYVLQSHNAMSVLWAILSLFGFIDAIASSLIDYKACQKNFNCTSSLTPDDCPPGEFLDVQITNNCCHGCRVGIGSKTLNLIPSLTCIIKSAFFSPFRTCQGRGESGCNRRKKCSPGLACDDDFYCILDRGWCMSNFHFSLISVFLATFHFQPHASTRCISMMLAGSRLARLTELTRRSSVVAIS